MGLDFLSEEVFLVSLEADFFSEEGRAYMPPMVTSYARLQSTAQCASDIERPSSDPTTGPTLLTMSPAIDAVCRYLGAYVERDSLLFTGEAALLLPVDAAGVPWKACHLGPTRGICYTLSDFANTCGDIDSNIAHACGDMRQD